MPARDAADRLASLQGFFDKANLLVVTPSPPTLGAQHIDLHSPGDLKARLKVKSSARQSNYTRRPPPGGYHEGPQHLQQRPLTLLLAAVELLANAQNMSQFDSGQR